MLGRDAFATKGKIVFLRLNSLDYVPSGLYSAQILSEKQHAVLAVEYGYFCVGLEKKNTGVPRLRLGHPWLRKLPGVLRAPLLNAIAWCRIVGLFLRKGRPHLLIAQGLSEQCLALFLYWVMGVRYAVHVHEVYDPKDVSGWNRLFLLLEPWALRNARFTVFPQTGRAGIYRKRYGLKAAQHIAFNCARLLPPPQPIDWRARLGLAPDSRLIGYWGGQGGSNALDHAIRAVARMPGVYFLLWGWSSPKDRERFKDLASGVGAAQRVLFLGELPDRKWDAIAGLDIGYCVYEPKELRLKHLATASNKFMESLASGVPVLASAQPDFQALVDFYDVGSCCADFSVDAIYSALKEMLDDPFALARKRKSALRCHSQVFHYEYQYQPVLRAVERELEWCARSAAAPRWNPLRLLSTKH